MIYILENFGNPIALLLSIIAAVIVSRRGRKKRPKTTRGFLVGLLYWGPLLLGVCMLLHLVVNAHRAYVSIRDTGVFNFYFYSLQLFGFVVGYQSYRLLKSCQWFVYGGGQYRRRMLLDTGLIVLITLPTLAFTVIGIVPPVLLAITLLTSLGVHRSPKTAQRSQPVQNPEMVQPLGAMA